MLNCLQGSQTTLTICVQAKAGCLWSWVYVSVHVCLCVHRQLIRGDMDIRWEAAVDDFKILSVQDTDLMNESKYRKLLFMQDRSFCLAELLQSEFP